MLLSELIVPLKIDFNAREPCPPDGGATRAGSGKRRLTALVEAGDRDGALQVLDQGVQAARAAGDAALRARLAGRERRRPGSLHRILRRLDPPSAARIHPRDVNKLVRAGCGQRPYTKLAGRVGGR